MKISRYLWIAIFLLFFVFAMDFWYWDEKIDLSFYGIPDWVFYFIGLQIFFSISLWIFSKTYWGKQKEQ